MPLHRHYFVETYTGLVGYGFDRPTDEATLTIYLQKISDDDCARILLSRLNQEEMDALFEIMSGLLRRHLGEQEYHALFLKDGREES
jgi:hypothetical protein